MTSLPLLRPANLPLAIWMLLGTLLLGLVAVADPAELTTSFGRDFGRGLGGFLLILLPSFILSETLGQRRLEVPGRFVQGFAPVLGAAMVCPDTAYATLSPIAGRHRLPMAFGAFSGFKLLYPAGPLIVATGLGLAASADILLAGLALFVPAWAAGQLWAGLALRRHSAPPDQAQLRAAATTRESMAAYAPIALLMALLILGMIPALAAMPGRLAIFATPAGALFAAAVLALALSRPEARRPAIEAGMRRTAGLLLLIGIAGAFGTTLSGMLPLEGWIFGTSGMGAVLMLFGVTAGFKMAQGSSMATFAAVTPVVAPFVAASGLSAPAAVMAICAGSLATILPNDSFFWLVREDALANLGDGPALWRMAGAGIVQALVALAGVVAGMEAGLW